MENRILFQTVKDQNLSLKKSGYEPRINPQEINFFWLEENKRSKLRVKDKKVVIDNTDVEVTLMQMESTPEKLSPNVMARPLYQESILPNVLYLGGSAEVEYWLPLQAAFDLCNLQYPILMQRDSNLMISKKNLEVLEKSGFEWSDLFKPEKDIAAQYFERDAHVSDKLTKIVDTITSELVSLNKELEKERKGSTSIYKDLHELQKGVAKLSRNISEEVLLSQKQNPELNRVLKIKTKFFDTKQERDEYTLSYPQILDSPNNDLSGMTAYLAIHST